MSESQPEVTAVAEPAPQPGESAPVAGASASPEVARIVLVGVLAAALVAAAVVLALFTHRESQLSAQSARRQGALAAARQEAVNFTSYDYRHLTRDFARVSADATGSFRKEFQTESGSLAQLISQSKAVAVGRVLDAGLVSISSSGATAIVALDDDVTNTAAPKGVVRNYRLQIVLSYAKGRWLVANIQPVA